MKKYDKNELAVLLLDSLDGFEYRHKAAILNLYKNAGELFIFPMQAVEYVRKNSEESLANSLKSVLTSSCDKYIDFILKKLDSRKIEAVTCLSTKYPKFLKNYPFYPLVIYAKGNIDLLNADKKIAIVGSRKTLPFALKRAEEISHELSLSGAVIISGSAVGGDRSAISGALDSGNIISVLAHGHDYIYPQTNRSLIDKVAENGLVISEYPPETPSVPWRFPMRNRLIAALCDCAFIISGEMTSGTRHTAKFAEAFSKRIYAFPYSICESSGEICNELIKMGKAQLVENAADLAISENIDLNERKTDDFEPLELEILSAMDGETDIDSLCEKTGKEAYEIISVLSMLEIKGAVCRGGQNTYSPLIKINKMATDDED